MMKSKLLWPLVLGLLLGGWATAHALAYRIVVPDAIERRHLLEETGHAYLDPAPLFALILTLFALGLVCSFTRNRPGFKTPWAFALLPPGAYVVQEHFERLLHDGSFPFAASLDPTFVVGLLLQIPFALAALLLARGLVALADALTRRGPRRSPRLVRGEMCPRGPIALINPSRIGLLALGHGQRAPPLLVLR